MVRFNQALAALALTSSANAAEVTLDYDGAIQSRGLFSKVCVIILSCLQSYVFASYFCTNHTPYYHTVHLSLDSRPHGHCHQQISPSSWHRARASCLC